MHKLLKNGSFFANIGVSKIWPDNVRKDLDQLYAAFEHEFAKVHATHGKSESRVDEREAARFFQAPESVESAFDIKYSADTYVGLMKTVKLYSMKANKRD